jgi:F-type H+-transporting ATPase subunit gamma
LATAREVRLRIKSVNNISQVTRALQTISASRVRKAQQAVIATRPYATQAWSVLQHLSRVSDREFLHPLLSHHDNVENVLIVLVTGDRGLAGAYNSNVLRFALRQFDQTEASLSYVVIGRKGRDVMARLGKDIKAEFSDLPAEISYADVSAIGGLTIEEFLAGRADQVFLVYTDFINLLRQIPTVKLLLPLEIDTGEGRVQEFEETEPATVPDYIYEPGQTEIIEQIVPRFTQLQLYQAMLESLASEHAARMVAMQYATENAKELASALTLEYNKARQLAITSDILDIVGGAEALSEQGGPR